MNYNNGTNGNNNNPSKSMEAEIKNKIRDLQLSKERYMREHDHKAIHRGTIKAVKDSKMNIPGKRDMSDTTVICEECGRFFEGEAYSKDDTESAMFLLMSVIEQIKFYSKLTGDDVDTIMSGYDALDILTNIVTYYHSMVDKLANNGNRKKKQNNIRQKGHLGVSPGMFNGGGRHY